MPQEFIHVKGAREHNLKNVDVTIPRNKLVVIPAFLVQAKALWLLTRFTLKASEDM